MAIGFYRRDGSNNWIKFKTLNVPKIIHQIITDTVEISREKMSERERERREEGDRMLLRERYTYRCRSVTADNAAKC